MFRPPLSGDQVSLNRVWSEFLKSLEKGSFDETRIRPLHDGLAPVVAGIAHSIAAKIPVDRWPKLPEMITDPEAVTPAVYFMVPLATDGSETTFCFSFVLDGERWFLRHIECITIPLTKVPDLPANSFPDIEADKKAWIREELEATERVRLWRFLKSEFGREFALNWFKDGPGYVLAARAWVPFLPLHEAFVLYLCWEQSRLRGSDVTLERLDASTATVAMTPLYLSVYAHATHLKEQISEEDYKSLWEGIWKDRAAQAGWNVEILSELPRCVLRFSRRINP